jgi:phosphoribosylaminoimidazolecarboxamide formyltransferase/IMP cyclohydrolase
VETFLECVIAPGYSAAARELLASKKNLRLVAAAGDWAPRAGDLAWSVRTIAGGALVQSVDTGMVDIGAAKLATSRAPSDGERADLAFAWRVAKHVKSNAIVFAKDGATVAIGAGQMSRVDSVRICERKAGAALRGAVVASDAFFPFRDGLDVLAEAGATAVIQPGGSVKDEEVIGAANEHKVAMLLTGMRHFRH